MLGEYETYDRDRLLHILRNPYGWNSQAVEGVRRWAGEEIHSLDVQINQLRTALEQAERERDEARDDRKRLIQHVAAMGHAITSSDPDYANDSWRSLPEHLQTEIESEEEHIDVLESGESE